MYKNYLISTFRNFKKHRLHTIINVTGLAIGISFCVLTTLFVQNEISYDNFHEKGDRIYLSLVQESRNSQRLASGATPPVLASTIRENIPGIESAVRMFGWFIKDGTFCGNI